MRFTETRVQEVVRLRDMGFYARYVLPRIVHHTCSLRPIMRQREKVVPLARGRVLEVGIGSGLNLSSYSPDRVSHVWGLDPSQRTWDIGKRQAEGLGFGVEFIEGSAEGIPLQDGSVDTVVATYTLCTIPDVGRSLREIGRVLEPGGRFLFCEHGQAPDPGVQKWQDRLNPLWKRLAGGCHLNRPIPSLLGRAGFTIEKIDTMYLPGWRPASFNYWGSAVHAVPADLPDRVSI